MSSDTVIASENRRTITESRKRNLKESNWRSIKAVEEKQKKIAHDSEEEDTDAPEEAVESPLVEHAIIARKKREKNRQQVEKKTGENFVLISLPRTEKRHLAHEITFSELERFLETTFESHPPHLENDQTAQTTCRVDLVKKQSLTRQPQYWLDIMKPTEETLLLLERCLGLHPLTVEDCLHTKSISHQKVEAFANYLFVASTEVKKAHDNAHNVTRSGIFIAAFQNLIISFHDDSLTAIDTARGKLAMTIDDAIEDGMHPTTDWILYAILDGLMDVQVRVAQSKMISLMDNEVETLDDLILDISTTNDQQDFMRRISYARRRLNYLQRELEEKHALVSALTTGSARRAMGGHMGALTAAQLGADPNEKVIIIGDHLFTDHDLFHAIYEVRLPPDILLHFRDVVSDIESMQEKLHSLSDSINNIMSVYLGRVNILLSEVNNDLTNAQKFFAAISTIGLPLGMVTSAWGMNEGVPGGIDDKGAPHPVGTFFALMGTLVGLAAIVLILFWRCKLL